MGRSTEGSTACLDVTVQLNKAWTKSVARTPAAVSAYVGRSDAGGAKERAVPSAAEAGEEVLMLCSDIITVDHELRRRPQFDMTAYVMEHAIAHTVRYCKRSGVTIRAFRSVEVLRLIQPDLPVSFLFMFEAILAKRSR